MRSRRENSSTPSLTTEEANRCKSGRSQNLDSSTSSLYTAPKMLLAGLFFNVLSAQLPSVKESGFHTGNAGDAFFRCFTGAIFSPKNASV